MKQCRPHDGCTKSKEVLSVKIDKRVKARLAEICDEYGLIKSDVIETVLAEFIAITETL